jgi:hypothetical protein
MPDKTAQTLIDVFLLILLPFMFLLALQSFQKSNACMATAKKTVKTISYSIVIDTDENILYLLKNGKPFKNYSCAVGKSETPSPLGFFKIVKKSLWGEGFGGYFLGLDCPWGDYGIHGTTQQNSVGYDSSHGCFRMYSADIEELYGYVGLNTPVQITGGCYGVFGSKMRPIGPGMYGADVRAIQARLQQLGYYSGNCNGRYVDTGFIEAVQTYQKDTGLQVSDYITLKMIASLGFVMIE